MIRFAARAPDLVFELIRRHGIACEARRSGSDRGHAVRAGHALDGKARCRLARTRRAGRPVGARRHRRALRLGGLCKRAPRSPGAAALNPLSYNRGLAAAAIRLGAVFHYDVEARELVPEGGGWRMRDESGERCGRAA